jgi:hypothetical protein
MIPVSENKCFLCKGKCCSYTTEALGTMRSKSDFEHLLWQVAHEGVEAYKDDSGWYLLYNGTCQFLQPDGLCGIYETRPNTMNPPANISSTTFAITTNSSPTAGNASNAGINRACPV